MLTASSGFRATKKPRLPAAPATGGVRIRYPGQLTPQRGLSFTRLSVAPGDRALVLVVEPSEGAIGLITLK